MLQVRVVFILTCSILLILQTSQPADGFILRLITETLQNNVAGEPITHERTEWNFDPEAAKKARAIYFEKNGFRSSKFIERLGVGLDGYHEERRKEQGERDLGRLNGEHNVNYPPPPV
ncbi:uncharacterized protein Dwil_GK22872 [Drosophila willistoni]|uniref:Cathepsin propeptide inhibitor domain-containing protein n=1 Tax=Drosophila willistoni TaxID=7260 RepID=B4NNL0_DROWI|nr:uncharacterized protein LOC6652082 [Drosophila willistoni]EDW85949.2 uncharacterized protein Dwil_GK22872 [Drosophila willistoni]